MLGGCEVVGCCSVEGMESVIATVSGYHGRERFKLIKLITRMGAHYVGTMGKSTTHLVCWELKGNKYGLAKSLGVKIVSHRWFEDCMKHGKRILENPYMMQSGKEVGALSWESWEDDCCCNRKLEMPMEHKHGKRKDPFNREKRDVLTDWSNVHEDVGGLACGSMFSELEMHCSHVLDKPGCTSISYSASGRKRNSPDAYEESRTIKHKGRRLRTKGTVFEYLTNDVFSNQGNHPTEICGQHESSNAVYSDNLSNSEILWYCSGSSADNRNPRIEEFEDIVELSNHMLLNSQANEIASSEGRKKMNAAPLIGSSLASPELSCVICWTEFSSTRGVLACGHRFCFACIQGWAKCTAAKGKVSTCPLCKASFTSITKVEGAETSDQKIYSQAVPCSLSVVDVWGVPLNQDPGLDPQALETICHQCNNTDPEDLLLCCHLCRSQWVHSCCLDPPLVPWTCVHCRDLRVLYQLFR